MRRNYATWLTKQQAADAIGISTKTIEKLADEGKLQWAKWKRPEGGNEIMVYHPRDVERQRKKKNPEAKPFILPPEKPPQRETAVAVRLPAAIKPPVRNNRDNQLLQVLQLLASQRSNSLYLTLPEAAKYTGLGIGYLRRLVESGTLVPLKGAGSHGAMVFRRTHLEAL
jgi:hypothetical protein